MLFAVVTLLDTEEATKAVVTWACTFCTFFRNRAGLNAWVTEWAVVVVTDLLAFCTLDIAVVKDTDALFLVAEFLFPA